jgi:hypothetical protein
MKQTVFYILLNLKTSKGLENFGKFYIGNNRDFAYTLFKKLKGSSKVNERSILTIELMETLYGLPHNLKIISCTLEEIADNCKLITKETFKAINLQELI